MMDIGNNVSSRWPLLLDMTKEECKKSLRALELSAYSQVVSVLRAQGELTKEKRKLLNDLQTIFSITLERHRAEIRRAVNDEKLNTIADTLAGPNTGVEWAVEGRRLIPLMPRVPPQTAYTAIATRMAMLYYGINSKMPPPTSTAMYGKMDNLGAESEDTDSEEETDGLRFISGPMVPPQYNSDQGSYTTLPQSQARLAKLPPKENRENREMPTTTVSGSGGPMSVPPNTSTTGGSSDKRKRKRSQSTDHPLPPPPPPPAPREHTPSPGTPTKQLSSIGRAVPGPPMKITVTGNVTRGTPGTPVSTLGGHTQKVILVSTSGASGVGGGMYQRSLSVPVMKGGTGAAQTVMRGVPTGPGAIPATQIQQADHQDWDSGRQNSTRNQSNLLLPPSSMTPSRRRMPSSHTGGNIGSGSMIVPSTYSSGTPTASAGMVQSGTYVNRMRPRVPSSALPPRPRQRSNSLVLQTEPGITQRGVESGSVSGGSSLTSSSHISTMASYSGGPPSIVGQAASQHSLQPTHLMTHQTIQVRPGTPVTPGKTAIQIRQEGTAGAKIITHTVAGSSSTMGVPSGNSSTGGGSSSAGIGPSAPNRLVGRTPILPPSSPQGSGGPLYVVTTNSGTITVVTRTVAAGQGTGPRVVTVNTINAPKSSVSGVRTASPATVVSVGPKTVQTVRVTPQGPAGLRPVLGGTKSNVIVVHKGAPPPGTRPVGIQGIRDVPTKITIGKGISSSGSTTVLQKPSGPRGTVTASSVTPSSSTPTSQGNVIVVDLSPEGSTVSNNNALADILQATGILGAGGPSSVGSGSIAAGGSGGDDVGSNEGETPRVPPSSCSVPSLSGTESTSTSLATSTRSSTPTVSQSVMSADGAPPVRVSGNNATSHNTVTNAVTPTSSLSVSTLANAVTTSASTVITTASVSNSSGSSSSCANEGGGGNGSSSAGSGEGDGEWLNLGLSSEDSPGHSLPEGQMQMLEEAVEILGRGDKESARNLLRQAGIELLDSPGDLGEQGGEATSMASLMAGLASQLPGSHLDEGPMPPVGELDPATGLFYNPSSTESSSDTNSNSASEDLETTEERESQE
ncbi:BRCA2-interacting transcriptional repressor EMSY isoform X3 [Penaeus vannamei]|uniref:BRCA2-interacting transcriptional repressor EMSY isoform X3 n=1 Tax=Penaeus vannamei TaxID=6689 RepID=UPI000F676683|nr:BRCA2-interacting transcriptional repressor EMSY-like isoform X4 [Penaeus vannamei]